MHPIQTQQSLPALEEWQLGSPHSLLALCVMCLLLHRIFSLQSLQFCSGLLEGIQVQLCPRKCVWSRGLVSRAGLECPSSVWLVLWRM